uniref:Uncharacterized protein n=1 Tax=Oryza rufipogon TaxID=4529 RepID=A0A0E0PXJ9_ORYRU
MEAAPAGSPSGNPTTPSSPSLSHDGYHPSSAPTTGGSPPQAGDADLVVRDDHGAAGELRAARRRQQLDGVALPVPHTSVASAPSPPGHFLTTGSRHWIPSPTEISPSDPATDLLKWWWWRGGGGVDWGSSPRGGRRRCGSTARVDPPPILQLLPMSLHISQIQCFLHDQYLSNLNEDRQIVIPVESEMVPAIRFESEMILVVEVRWAAGGQWRSGRSAASAAEAEHTRAAGGGGGGGGRWCTGLPGRRRSSPRRPVAEANRELRHTPMWEEGDGDGATCGGEQLQLQGGHEGVTREEDVAAAPSILPETGGIMHLVPNLRPFGLGVAELERLNCGGDPLHDLNAAMAALESSASAAAAVRASSVSATDCSLHHWPPAARESSVSAADCPLPLAAHRPGKLRHRPVHLRLRCARLARGCVRERENRERNWV